ncbi:MAG: triose-phosphate isomerase [Candidatus Kapaibacteriales bacterium]
MQNNELYIAGNWKMNLGLTEAKDLIQSIDLPKSENIKVIVSPIFPLLYPLHGLSEEKGIYLSGQNCNENSSGAYTGEVPASLLKEVGCSFCIVGHSERRDIYGEDNTLVTMKAVATSNAGLRPIICIGEKLEDRENSNTEKVLSNQLSVFKEHASSLLDPIIAYEPVWAIGTGKTPTLEQISDTHNFIKEYCDDTLSIKDIPVLYGGSLKPDNAKEIISIDSVDGGLIGGASLKPDSFNSIINIAQSI